MSYVLEHFESLIQEAGAEHWPHVDYLARLIEGEAHRREDRSIQRRVALARFPVLKTLDSFDWAWPQKINRPQIQNLFRLRFIEDKANLIFIANVGLGKSHLSIALGHSACLRGYSVLFTTAVDIINSLSAAQAHGNLKRELHKYLQPRLLVVDELGYLPMRPLRSSQTSAITGFHTGAEIFYPSLGPVFRPSAVVYALAINFHPTPNFLVGKQEKYSVTST